jgi:hypothetical protein
MKKLLLYFIFSFSLLNVSAQYYRMLDSVNVWSYTGNIIGVVPPDQPDFPCSYPFWVYEEGSMYTEGDTVINSTSYRILIAQVSWNSPCVYGYLREDTSTQKIYFLDVNGSPEILLYDFSMQIGDQIFVDFNSSGYFPTDTYRLDSITTIAINAGVRRVFNLNCTTCGSGAPTLTWVESVGNLGDVIYPYSMNQQFGMLYSNCPGFPHEFSSLVICFDHDQKVYYDSCAREIALQGGCIAYFDTCHYHNICWGIDELNPLSFAISPNPAHNNFTINSKIEISGAVLEIYNTLGAKVHSEMINRKQQTIHFEPESGIYFVKLNDGKNSYAQKLIIE